MRLGLVGRGPQAQRYLMPKNGGAHIISQVPGRIECPEYQDWLQGVDGVIIATHPAGHRRLALDAIGQGKSVLCEKPLALTLADCEEIIDAAADADVRLRVASPYLWDDNWDWSKAGLTMACAVYSTHSRDYSAWLDWGPHVLALACQAGGWSLSPEELRALVSVVHAPTAPRSFIVAAGKEYDGKTWSYCSVNADTSENTPMANVVDEFLCGESDDHEERESYRRVYRALFAQENHGTT